MPQYFGDSTVTNAPEKRFRPRRWLARSLLFALLAWLGLSIIPVLLLRWLPPPTTAFMLQYAATDALAARPYRYHWTDWQHIAPAISLAVVAAEDQKFPAHQGFDFASIENAIRDYLHSGELRGASTISQQVAKNLFLWPGRNLGRKALEAWFTLLIELAWPKQRILEVYLNIAEFGPGIYGVEAASRTFFGKSATLLEPGEAALLATVLPNPRTYDAANPSAYMRQRQRWIQQQMRQLGGPAYVNQMPQ